MGGVNFEEVGIGIDEHERTAGGAHNADGFADDQLQGFLGIERGMDDVADLIKQAQAFRRQFGFRIILAHLFKPSREWIFNRGRKSGNWKMVKRVERLKS